MSLEGTENGNHAAPVEVYMAPTHISPAVAPDGFVWAAQFRHPDQFERFETEGGVAYKPHDPEKMDALVARPIASWQIVAVHQGKLSSRPQYTMQSICMSPDSPGLIVAELHPLYMGISLERIGPEKEKKDSGLVVARYTP